MKQKVTSIFLLATLVLSLLVGCSTDEGNSSNYPDESPSSVSSGIVGSPQSTDSVEQSSADADDSGVEAEDPSGSNGQSNMTGQEIDQPVSSTLPTEITAATSFSLSDVKPYSGSAYVNSHRFKLSANLHPNKRLQQLWQQYGENGFNYAVVEILKYENKDDDQTEKLTLLLEEYLAQTPQARRLSK